jgi:hypothetical protein
MLASTRGTAVALNRFLLCRKILFVPLLLCCVPFPANGQITIQGSTPQRTPKQGQNSSEIRLDFYMTPEEAARLLGAVDVVIEFDSKVTGLPVRTHVERELTDRETVKRHFQLQLQNDEFATRLKRSSLVLKKLGFIPRDFDLQRFAVESSAQALAGYYEPRAKTIYLLNWLPTRAQLPVMAHELTHALQDQNFGLENWIKLEDATGKNLPEIERDDHQAARRAVAEGHATAVMLDYLFAPYNKSLADFPAIESEVLQRAQQVHNTIAVAQAPLFLREASAFPYTYGLEFIHQVLLKAGKERAYSGVFKKPPRSTRQIMEPGTYLADEKIPPDEGAAGRVIAGCWLSKARCGRDGRIRGDGVREAVRQPRSGQADRTAMARWLLLCRTETQQLWS